MFYRNITKGKKKSMTNKVPMTNKKFKLHMKQCYLIV